MKRTILITAILFLSLFVVQGYAEKPKPVVVENSPDVYVTNGAQEPVPVREVDKSIQKPIQASISVNPDTSQIPPDSSPGGTIYTVPSGKRLVIEYVTVQVLATHIDKKFQPEERFIAFIKTTLDNNDNPHLLGALSPPLGLGSPWYDRQLLTQTLRLYADPGTDVDMWIMLGEPSFFRERPISFEISGYLLDVP